MTPNFNPEDAAHIVNILKGQQAESSLMLALAKQHTEQVSKLVSEAKSATKAMGELYEQLCQRISGATKAGARDAVANFSLEANGAALTAAKNVGQELKRTSDLLSEATVSLSQLKKRGRMQTLSLAALLLTFNIGVALYAAKYFAAVTDKKVSATLTYNYLLARGIEFTFLGHDVEITLPAGAGPCRSAQAKNGPAKACVLVPQAR
jgi:hypothetical protein